MNVGAAFTSPIVGPLDYSFANYKIQAHDAAGVHRERRSRREIDAGSRDQEIDCRRLQRREPRPGDPREVRPPRGPDRPQPRARRTSLGDRGDAGQRRRRRTTASSTPRRRWRPADRSDHARGRPAVRVPRDRPGRTTQDGGAPGGEHPRRVPLPHRSRPEFIDRPGGDSTTPTVGRLKALGPAAPRSARAGSTVERGVRRDTQAARRRVQRPRQEAVRDRQPLQLEGRRPAAVRPLPAADAASARSSGTARRRS